MSETERIKKALFLSDLHLGWSVCYEHHISLLARLDEAVEDAELVVLNGDILDEVRGVQRSCDRELVAQFCETVARWRAEGRRVVYVEGNHDPRPEEESPLYPETWCFDFVGHLGERVRALHGHRFSEAHREGLYGAWGSPVIRAENYLLARAPRLRRWYGAGHGWLVGAWGCMEDFFWRRRFPERVRPLLAGCDVLVHGHFHFGPGQGKLEGVPYYRSGAWVSRGHLGSVDRMLRYDRGRFTRIGLTSRGFAPFYDGR